MWFSDSFCKVIWLLLAGIILAGCGGGGGGASEPSSSSNAPPVASAGSIQNVTTGTLVTLNGSASSDANGDPLTYSWTLTSKPASSTATLTGATSAAPTFTADLAGTYVASLTVNDGQVNSVSASVTITATVVTIAPTVANAAPVANAGPAQNVTTGTLVTLNGSASSDANGDPLTYLWAVTSVPTGSLVGGQATAAIITFTPDVQGTYVISLVVNDGMVNSTAATVTITASVGNAAPVANAGVGQIVTTGTLVTLNGSASSDANGDPLSYLWAVTSVPTGSLVGGQATAAIVTFTPDVQGTYVISLVVNDGMVNSTMTTVTVIAINPVVITTAYYLYGGTNNSVYLGCLNCGRYQTDAVCNTYGTYGSMYATNSIWNAYGTYGSPYASSSPWNEYSSSGPIIIGSDGVNYGVFTANKFASGRTTISNFVSVLDFYSSTKSVTATQTYACP